MKPQHKAKIYDKRLNCRTCSGGHPTAMHGHVPKRKKNAQDGQMSNESDESVANSFADLKTLSTVEKHQRKVISMCIVSVKVKSTAQGKNVLTYAMLDNCSQKYFIQEITLNLKTLNVERSESTIAIDRLQVAISKDGNTWIKLPRIYTRKHLPIDKKEVATPEKIEALKVIASNNGGTYAYQTRLAWCIVEVTWLAKIQLVATVLQYMIK